MGYIEDNHFRPIPSYENIAALNVDLERLCRANLDRMHAMHHERIGDRFDRERGALGPVPDPWLRPCVLEYARVNKFGEVTVGTNRYSVPSRYVGRDAIVEVSEDAVAVLIGDQRVAEHRRGRGRHEFIIDPLHCIGVIAHKHRSATRALALADERLPRSLVILRDRLLERDGPTATKTWMAVLQLALTTSLAALGEATEVALASGTLDAQAIALLLRQRGGTVTGCLDLGHHHGAPAVHAQAVSLDAYRIAALAERAL